MKLSCTKENLCQGLAITSHISTKNVNLPILTNVLMKADGGGLKLISTNLEIAITCNVRGKVEQQGEYTVPSKLFYDYVNLLPNEKLDIDLHDDGLSVICQGSKTKLKGIDAQEFPLIPPASGENTYQVSVSGLKRSLSQVLFSAATNESRPELSGIFIKFEPAEDGKGTIVFAATDSYRLSEVTEKLSGGQGKAHQVIVPQRTLSELNRVLGVFKDDVEAPDLVTIQLSDNQIGFHFGSVEITSRTIDGAYPNYKQVIPESTKTSIVVDKAEFQKAVKTVSLFSKTGMFDIHLNVNEQEQKLELSAKDMMRGENAVALKAMIEGGDNSISLNYRYLLDGINAIQTDKIVLKMTDGASPCLLLPFESEEEQFKYIVMPIRQ